MALRYSPRIYGAGNRLIARGLDPNYLDMDALIEKRLGGCPLRNFSRKREKKPSSDRV